MTDLRTAAQQALEALKVATTPLAKDRQEVLRAQDALRAALAQQDEPAWMHPWPPVRAQQAEPVQEPVAWLIDYEDGEREVRFVAGTRGIQRTPLYTAPPQRQPETLDDAMQQPRAMAQAYENGYKAGVAHEREECAKLCEARFVGDLTREDMEARRCAAAIRARGEQP